MKLKCCLQAIYRQFMKLAINVLPINIPDFAEFIVQKLLIPAKVSLMMMLMLLPQKLQPQLSQQDFHPLLLPLL